MSLADALSLLDDAATATDRATAMAIIAEQAAPDLQRFLAQRTHLVVRGGARALLREALSEPAGAAPHAWAAAQPAPLFTRIATTRTPSTDDARIRTIEAGGDIGRAIFTPDGASIMAFAYANERWPCRGPRDRSSCVATWRVATGEFITGTYAGQFREGEGTLALSADGTRVAVRAHRHTHVHEVDPVTHAVSPAVLYDLAGAEGANHLTFLANGRVLADDGYDLCAYTMPPEAPFSCTSSIGNGGHAIAAHKLFVGGGYGKPGPTLAVHDLTSLTLDAVATAPALPRALPAPRWLDVVGTRGALISALASSPSQAQLASGDWLGDIRLWSVAELATCTGSLAAPARLTAPRLASHDGWVSALAFVTDDRLLSAGWDGAVLDIDLAHGVTRALHGHHGHLTSLDVSPDRRLALSADAAGCAILWDLTRGSSVPPPFLLPYGGHPPPIVLRVTPDHVRIAVGWTEALFDHRGTLLTILPCEPPPAASRSPHSYADVRGFESSAIDLEVTAYTAHDELEGDPVGPALVVTRDAVVLDVIALDAPALAFAWIDRHTLVVLDRGGHIAFWRT